MEVLAKESNSNDHVTWLVFYITRNLQLNISHQREKICNSLLSKFIVAQQAEVYRTDILCKKESLYEQDVCVHILGSQGKG